MSNRRAGSGGGETGDHLRDITLRTIHLPYLYSLSPPGAEAARRSKVSSWRPELTSAEPDEQHSHHLLLQRTRAGRSPGDVRHHHPSRVH